VTVEWDGKKLFSPWCVVKGRRTWVRNNFQSTFILKENSHLFFGMGANETFYLSSPLFYLVPIQG
jgi:hypothetical protein